MCFGHWTAALVSLSDDWNKRFSAFLYSAVVLGLLLSSAVGIMRLCYTAFIIQLLSLLTFAITGCRCYQLLPTKSQVCFRINKRFLKLNVFYITCKRMLFTTPMINVEAHIYMYIHIDFFYKYQAQYTQFKLKCNSSTQIFKYLVTYA